MRIETATDFLATVEEGAVLYQLHSWHGEPSMVERITVNRVERIPNDGIWGAEPELICHYLSARGTQARGYVADMLNQWHGVWTELQEALSYFEERRAAYRTDPELIAEVQASKADFRRLSTLWGWPLL